MGVKYFIHFKSIDEVRWRIDIDVAGFVGDPISIRGVYGAAAMLSYSPTDTDDPFSPYINSTLTMNLYNQGSFDIRELQKSEDKNVIIRLYEQGSLYWVGYLKTEGIQRLLQATPNEVQLSATDGLSMLDDIDYTHNNLPGIDGLPKRLPINFIRQILFANSNLGLPLPIKWTNQLECTAYPNEDVFAGDVEWGSNGEAFYSFQAGADGTKPGPIKKCGEILEGILRSTQCRIYQAQGMWIIRRIPDTVSGYVFSNTIGNDLGTLTIQKSRENITNLIGRNGYSFLLEDHIITNKPGVKSCKVTYVADIRENILPNGNQDVVLLGSFPLYWGSYDGLLVETIGYSLDGRDGNSSQLTNTSPTDLQNFTLVSQGGTLGNDGLPIDSKTLIKILNFGFYFSAVSGFATLPSSTVIDWSTNPLLIQVIFNLGVNKFYLNEFGYWVLNPTYVPIVIDGLEIAEVAKVNFDKFQGIILPTDSIQPEPGVKSDIQVIFVTKPGQKYVVDNIAFTIEDGNDVYESDYTASKNTMVDKREISISSSYSGYMLSNFMTGWDKSDSECFFRDGLAYEGTLTGLTANAIMRYRYKASEIYNGSMNVRNKLWSFDQIYLIDTFGQSKFLPLNATYNVEKAQVNLIAIECRNENPILVEKYYSSNDNQLSN